MRQRRVGTISMGVLLVGLGGYLLYAQFRQQAALDTIITWWPLILFLLGGEILWHAYTAREEQGRIKYDLFSIFIVLTVVLVSMGVFALTQVGIIPRLSMMVAAQSYTLNMPAEEITIESSIKKIVIEAPSRAKLVVRTGTEEKAAAYGKAVVTADSRERASQLLGDKTMVTRRAGDTLFVSFDLPITGSDFGYHARVSEFLLVLPGDRAVEINSDVSLEVSAENLKNNWFIDSQGNVAVKLPQGADVEVAARVYNERDLGGDVKWSITKENTGGENNRQEVQGLSSFGQGQYKLKVISRGEVLVNIMN